MELYFILICLFFSNGVIFLGFSDSLRVSKRKSEAALERHRLKETEWTYCTSVSRCTAVGCVTKALSGLRVSTQWGQTVIPPGY